MERTVLHEVENKVRLSDEDRSSLLALAHRAVAEGAQSRSPLSVQEEQFSSPLRAERAAFVTVYVDGELRGCTGELEARRSLVSCVLHHAYSAAFLDERFPPIQAQELPRLRISISLIVPQERIEFEDEHDLLQALEPGVHGLTISARGHHASFLPQVWETLPDPEGFLAHLKVKAGLPVAPIPGLQAWRYRSENFSDQ
jgi:AmmeMemoRadiSam system protein A